MYDVVSAPTSLIFNLSSSLASTEVAFDLLLIFWDFRHFVGLFIGNVYGLYVLGHVCCIHVSTHMYAAAFMYE